MNHRLASVLAEESIVSAATKVIDLDMADIISRIQINVEVEGDGTALSDHLAAVISNIELIDGSDVLFSMSGKECQALDYYQNKQMPFNALTEQDGQDMIAVFNINFGRFLYDELLAFDPTKFRNPQLKITHAYTACGSASGVARMEVRAFLFDEKTPSPEGFLMSKEHYQYDTGTEGTFEYVDMPTDYLTRRYMIMGTAADKFCQQVVNEIRLSEDNAKRIPYDTKVWQLLKWLHQMYPRIEEYGHFYLKAATSAIYASPTQDLVINSVPADLTNFISVSSIPIKMPITMDITADGIVSAQISGYDPHYSFILPCGKADDPADWYDVTKLGNLKMRLKSGSADSGNTVEIVTEQLRKY
jgi:hypothetical protein